MHLPLPQWVAYIFCIPSSTLSSPHDSHSRSSADDQLNVFSHSLMDAITSCHKKEGKYQWNDTETRWRLCLKWALAERRAARCDEFTLGICRYSRVLRTRKRVRNASEIQPSRRLQLRPGVYKRQNFEVNRICALLSLQRSPAHPSRPAPRRLFGLAVGS